MQEDLLASSQVLGEEGVYPPYVQMLVDHIWRHAKAKKGAYSFKAYSSSGSMDGVAGGYLTRQLSYAEDREGHLREILASLVRSYGVKAQKNLNEIATDLGLAEDRCESLLERLIDMRLVRHIGIEYEVAHDFLAREISAKLVDTEEREFKRFRELLGSKAAAFATTRATLTNEELLLLYKHKERVLPTEPELRIILASWARGAGPGLYWLLSASASKLLEFLQTEEGREDLEEEARAALILLRRKITGMAIREEGWKAFRKYRLASEMKTLLVREGVKCPDTVLALALRSRHRSVRAAAFEALREKSAHGQYDWIAKLWKSASAVYREAYERLTLCDDIPLLSEEHISRGDRALREFHLLQQIARATDELDVRNAVNSLRAFRPKARSWLFALGLSLHRLQGFKNLIKKAESLAVAKGVVVLSAIRSGLAKGEFQVLLDAYIRANKKEALFLGSNQERRYRIYEQKANALAETILRTADGRTTGQLRQAFQRIRLTASAQHLAVAVARHCGTKGVLEVIDRVERAEDGIPYWFQIEIARTIEETMVQVGKGVPPSLLRVCNQEAFWHNPAGEKQETISAKQRLPLRYSDNRTLYIRLVAHAVIGASRLKDSDLLCRLARHDYQLVARSAAVRLVALHGDAAIRLLQGTISKAIESGEAESLATAIRDAEIQQMGLAQLW